VSKRSLCDMKYRSFLSIVFCTYGKFVRKFFAVTDEWGSGYREKLMNIQIAIQKTKLSSIIETCDKSDRLPWFVDLLCTLSFLGNSALLIIKDSLIFFKEFLHIFERWGQSGFILGNKYTRNLYDKVINKKFCPYRCNFKCLFGLLTKLTIYKMFKTIAIYKSKVLYYLILF
jgi:hypothetical protein